MKHLFAILALCVAAPVVAQEPQTFTINPAAPRDAFGAIPLGTPQLADMPPEQWFWQNGDIGVRNVSVATLTPFLPPKGTASGAAVIVAPGGGFLGLAIDTEGYRVAQWLSDHGIAAFVLKYRVLPTPAKFETFRSEMIAVRTGTGPASFALPADTPPRALEDARVALATVRGNAANWGVDPKRVGMMGFSAGARTTISAALASGTGARPDFIAPIYGPLYGPYSAEDVKSDAPPMFAAIAADDPLYIGKGYSLIDAWIKAKRPVEFHLFQNGSHGFGMGKPGTTAMDWIVQFRRWMDANGFLNQQER